MITFKTNDVIKRSNIIFSIICAIKLMYSNPTPHTNSGRKKTSSIKAQTQMTVIVLGTIRDTDGLNVEKKAGVAAMKTYIFGALEDIVKAAVRPKATITDANIDTAEENMDDDGGINDEDDNDEED
jgi:hypothetical protein